VFGVLIGLTVIFFVLGKLLGKVGGYAPGWRIRCLSCGKIRPATEAGIIRIVGAGKSYKFLRCGTCEKLRWVALERDPAFERDKAIGSAI